MWSYEGAPTDEDRVAEHHLNKLIANERVARGFSRFWSLYRHLVQNPPTSSNVLQKTIFVDRGMAIPFFDEVSSKKVVGMWKIIHDPSYFSKYLVERFKKKGGAVSRNDVIDRAADYAVSVAGEKVAELGISPESPGIAGTVATAGTYAKWILSLPMRIIPWIEENPYIGGPFWKLAIRLFLELIPRLIMMIESIVPVLAIPLMPVFGIGAIIEVVAMGVTTVLGLMTVFLSVATGKMGSAFINFLQLIPFVGPALRMSVVNVADTYRILQEQRSDIANVPVVGPILTSYIPAYEEPAKQQTNGGTRRRRRRRTHKKSA